MKTLIALLVCALVSTTYSQEEVCCEDPEMGCFNNGPPFEHLPLPSCDDEIVYVLFTPANPDVGIEFSRMNVPDLFDPSLRTLILIHGYTNTRNEDWLADMRAKLLQTEDYNVIIVGWGEGADAPLWAYDKSASNTRVTGKDVALMVDNLVANHGAAHEDMWCIGHSLGAHTCGTAGMNTHLGRVTGMDPAGPEFEGYPLECGVNPTSADFVDIIHTNGKGSAVIYGQNTPLGHIDFYPNGGGMQPGCFTAVEGETIDDWDVSCSHGRARDYFIESIGNDCFTSCSKCPDQFDQPETCDECLGCAIMGYGAEWGQQTTGLFYHLTGSGSDNRPFCEFQC